MFLIILRKKRENGRNWFINMKFHTVEQTQDQKPLHSKAVESLEKKKGYLEDIYQKSLPTLGKL